MICYAMLLDGGFVRYKLSTPSSPVDAAGVSAFTAKVSALSCLQGMRLHRIYFYDSKPLESAENKPLGGGRIDFGSSTPAVPRSEHSTKGRRHADRARYRQPDVEETRSGDR